MSPQSTHPPPFEVVYTIGLSFLRQTLRWLGVAERDLDDVLQDVMLAAYRNLDTYDPTRTSISLTPARPHDVNASSRLSDAPSEPLKRWLFGIAWRQVSHYRDRAYRRREVSIGAGVTWPFHPMDPSPNSECLLIHQQRSNLINRVLAKIDIDRRVVLIMYDLLDLSITDIATELSVNENTVRNRLRLAREDFRIAVKRMNAEERNALRTLGSLSVSELSKGIDPLKLLDAARIIPPVPDSLRHRLWTNLKSAIAFGVIPLCQLTNRNATQSALPCDHP